MMKENTIKVLDYLKENYVDGVEITANDIAKALGLEPRSVTGSLTALNLYKNADKVNVPLIVRVPASDNPKTKFIHLTDAGREFVPPVPQTEE